MCHLGRSRTLSVSLRIDCLSCRSLRFSRTASRRDITRLPAGLVLFVQALMRFEEGSRTLAFAPLRSFREEKCPETSDFLLGRSMNERFLRSELISHELVASTYGLVLQKAPKNYVYIHYQSKKIWDSEILNVF